MTSRFQEAASERDEFLDQILLLLREGFVVVSEELPSLLLAVLQIENHGLL